MYMYQQQKKMSSQCVSALIERVQRLTYDDLPNTVFLETANKILTTGLPETVVELAEELTQKNVAALHVKTATDEYEERIQQQKDYIEELDAERTSNKDALKAMEVERTADKARIEELEAALATANKGRETDRATWTDWYKHYEGRFNALLAEYNRVTRMM